MAYWMIRTAWDENVCHYTEVKQGDPTEDEGGAFCSECGGDALENTVEDYVWSRFCPHCGAKMENWQTDEQREAADEEWSRKQQEKWEKMTPEEKAIEEKAIIESFGPLGATGTYWREDYEGGK